MSSRILRDGQLEAAQPLRWKSMAKGGEIADGTNAGPNHPKGPTWEEHNALGSKLGNLESQIPAIEQQARQAAIRELEAAANAKWESALERATRSVSDAASLRGRLRREAEQDVVRLSMAMARKILRRELTIDPEALLYLAKTAMERLEMHEIQRVRVRPEDAVLVSAFLEKIGSPHRVEVVPDPALERGGLVLETERGHLDASVETQLEEIERGFADLLDRGKQP